MKIKLVAILSLISVTTFAREVKIEQFEQTQICFSNGAPGSTHTFLIDGSHYLVDVLNSDRFSIKRVFDQSTANAGKCLPVTVVGYLVSEKGHFPNPMASFNVVKVMDMSLN